MSYKFVCVFCETHNVLTNPCLPDSQYCKVCHKHQDTGELNWKPSMEKFPFPKTRRRF